MKERFVYNILKICFLLFSYFYYLFSFTNRNVYLHTHTHTLPHHLIFHKQNITDKHLLTSCIILDSLAKKFSGITMYINDCYYLYFFKSNKTNIILTNSCRRRNAANMFASISLSLSALSSTYKYTF